jgi:ribonuclease HII
MDMCPRSTGKAPKSRSRRAVPAALPGLEEFVLPTRFGPEIAGIDEAGRGCLAGPVVAACVVLPESFALAGLDDSKKLEPEDRERLYPQIKAQALAWGIAASPPARIDEINILEATFEAMAKACAKATAKLANKGSLPKRLFVDGSKTIPHAVLAREMARRVPAADLPSQRAVVKGDSLVAAISAASVLAKVWRDRYMDRLARVHPLYGFEENKGYGTMDHLARIACHGPCPVHRLTFQGVKEHVGKMDAGKMDAVQAHGEEERCIAIKLP